MPHSKSPRGSELSRAHSVNMVMKKTITEASRKGLANIGRMNRKVFWNPSRSQLEELLKKSGDLRGGGYHDGQGWHVAFWPSANLTHWNFFNELLNYEGVGSNHVISFRVTPDQKSMEEVKDWKDIVSHVSGDVCYAVSPRSRYSDIINDGYLKKLFPKDITEAVAPLFDHKQVVTNPSAERLKAMVKKAKHNDLRGIYDGVDLHFWDASLGTHDGVAHAIGIQYDYRNRINVDVSYGAIEITWDEGVPKSLILKAYGESGDIKTAQSFEFHGNLNESVEEIIRNPSDRELIRLYKDSYYVRKMGANARTSSVRNPALRGLRDAEGNYYLADANQYIHSMMYNQLRKAGVKFDLDDKSEVIIYANGTVSGDVHYNTSAPKAEILDRWEKVIARWWSRQKVTEATPIKPGSHYDINFPMWKNPTRSSLQQLAKHGDLRGLVDGKGDILVWKAVDSDHHRVQTNVLGGASAKNCPITLYMVSAHEKNRHHDEFRGWETQWHTTVGDLEVYVFSFILYLDLRRQDVGPDTFQPWPRLQKLLGMDKVTESIVDINDLFSPKIFVNPSRSQLQGIMATAIRNRTKFKLSLDNHAKDNGYEDEPAYSLEEEDMVVRGSITFDNKVLLVDAILGTHSDLSEYDEDKISMADFYITSTGILHYDLHSGNRQEGFDALSKLAEKWKLKLAVRETTITEAKRKKRRKRKQVGGPIEGGFEGISETIVYKDRFVQAHNTGKTIVLVNPTKAEWEMLGKEYPRGAAGVIMKNGDFIVGNGDATSHEDLCNHANMNIRNEYARVQLSRTAAYLELWSDTFSEWSSYEQKTPLPPFDAVQIEVLANYGKTLEELEQLLKKKVSKFMGDVPVMAIPMDYDGQQSLIPGGDEFIKKTWAISVSEAKKERLYYVQPDGTWSPIDGRGVGLTKNEVEAEGGEIVESFLSGHKNWKGNPVELFKNPDKREYLQVLGDNDQVRALILGDDLIIWNVFSDLHVRVMEQIKAPNTVIPVVIYGRPGDPVASVQVTDASKSTVWHHNGNVDNEIFTCAALQQIFVDFDISYYDEDIVGSWSSLNEAASVKTGSETDLKTRRFMVDITKFAKANGIMMKLRHPYRYAESEVEITDLFAKQTGTGAGTKVMHYIAQKADEAGCNVYVQPGDLRNMDFYSRFGFVSGPYGQMVRYSKMDIDEATVVNDGRQWGDRVSKNPTRRSLEALTKTWGDIRGTVADNGEVYIWPAMDNIHSGAGLRSTIRSKDGDVTFTNECDFYVFANPQRIARLANMSVNDPNLNNIDPNQSFDWAIVSETHLFPLGSAMISLSDFKKIESYTHYPKMARLLKSGVNENVIKLGSKSSPGLQAFMADYEENTSEHPINHRARLVQGAAMEVRPFDGMIHISDIMSLKQGGGREALELLCNLADKHGVKMGLTAKSYQSQRPGLDTNQLKAWYERHGFVEDEDTFGDDEQGYDMIRWPQGLQEATQPAWTLSSAKQFVSQLRKNIRGFDIEIVGGVVKRGHSDKDVDLALVPNAKFSNVEEASDYMARIGAKYLGNIQKMAFEAWQLSDGRRVDFFFDRQMLQHKRKKRSINESAAPSRLGDLITVKLKDEDADFWVVRRGSLETVGKPVREYNPEHYGIKVTRTDLMLPDYLFYMLHYIHMQGVFKRVAKGTLKLVNITADQLKAIPIGQKQLTEGVVTNEAGKPLVVYHGTNQTFDEFSKTRGGLSTGPQAGARHGFFFTSDPDEAQEYAEHAGRRVVANINTFEKETERLRREQERLEKVAERSGREEDWRAYEVAYQAWEDYEINATQEDPNTGVNVIAAHLILNNPLVVNFNGTMKSEHGVIEDVVQKAVDDGHDGVIMRNIYDSPVGGRTSDHYVVFSAKQIKRVDATKTLKEVNEISPFDDNLNQHRKREMWGDIVNQSSPDGKIKGFKVLLADDPKGKQFVLMDGKEPVGKVSLYRETQPYYTVKHIWFEPRVRNQGLGLAIYEYLLNKGYDIATDYDQTVLSKSIWKRLVQRQDVRELLSHDVYGDERVTPEEFEQFYAKNYTNFRRLVAVSPLKESSVPDDGEGYWVLPDGSLIYCSYEEGKAQHHIDVARKHFPNGGQPEAYEKGWVRYSRSNVSVAINYRKDVAPASSLRKVMRALTTVPDEFVLVGRTLPMEVYIEYDRGEWKRCTKREAIQRLQADAQSAPKTLKEFNMSATDFPDISCFIKDDGDVIPVKRNDHLHHNDIAAQHGFEGGPGVATTKALEAGWIRVYAHPRSQALNLEWNITQKSRKALRKLYTIVQQALPYGSYMVEMQTSATSWKHENFDGPQGQKQCLAFIRSQMGGPSGSGLREGGKQPVSEAKLIQSFGYKIWRNPSNRDIIALSRLGDLRGLIFDNSVYVWEAYKATHGNIFSVLAPHLVDFDDDDFEFPTENNFYVFSPEGSKAMAGTELDWSDTVFTRLDGLSFSSANPKKMLANKHFQRMLKKPTQPITEGTVETVNCKNDMGYDIRLKTIWNPSPQQLDSLFASSRDAWVRGLVYDKGIVVWDAYQSDHHHAGYALGIEVTNNRFFIHKYSDTDYRIGPNRFVETLSKVPALARLARTGNYRFGGTDGPLDEAVVDTKKTVMAYHGSHSKFDTFKIGMIDSSPVQKLGIWFTSSEKAAKRFASDLDHASHFGIEEAWVAKATLNFKKLITVDGWEKGLHDLAGAVLSPYKYSQYNDAFTALKTRLLDEGYDGIEILNSTTDRAGKRTDYVVLDTKVISNVEWTEYPDIKWHVNEAVVDTIGRFQKPVYQNPSRLEYKKLVSNLMAPNEPDAIRAILDPDTGDIYIWDGFFAAHGGLKDRYKLPKAFHLTIKNGQVTVLTLWRCERDGYTKQQVHELVTGNKHLQSLLGKFELEIQK